MDYGTHMKNASARVHIGEAPYYQMERNDMEAEIIYGTDEKGRLYTKKQLGGEVLAIRRWKSLQHYVDGKPAARITEHTWSIGHIHVSSGNSHHAEPMVGVAWSKVPPIHDRTADTERASRFFAELVSMWGDEYGQNVVE